MNEAELNSNLHQAFPEVSESAGLDRKVDDALRHYRHKIMIRRRFTFSVLAAGCIALGLFAIPVVRANASIAQMAHALDNVSTVAVSTSTVDSHGNRTKSGLIVYDHGNWFLDYGRPEGATYYWNGHSYVIDPTLKVFTTRDEPNGPFHNQGDSFKVSSLIAQMGSSVTHKLVSTESTTLNGRPVTRIQIDHESLPERYIFFADPKTELPVEMHVEGKELGTWKLVQVMTFTYGGQVDPHLIQPDLKKYPVLTEEAANKRFVDSMEASKLAELPLKRGMLTIHKFDIAEDGTVFVVFQSGNRATNSWRGYPFALTDDQGTRYLPLQMFVEQHGQGLSIPKAGLIETEVFVPLDPIPSGQTRHLKLGAMRDSHLDLVRQVEIMLIDENGKLVKSAQPNYFGNSKEGTWSTLLRQTISKATCQERPSYISRVAYETFSTDIDSQITKLRTRAKARLDDSQWQAALPLLEEEARKIDEREHLGYGPMSRDDVLKDLQTAKDGLKRP